jgi:hypothetical protein
MELGNAVIAHGSARDAYRPRGPGVDACASRRLAPGRRLTAAGGRGSAFLRSCAAVETTFELLATSTEANSALYGTEGTTKSVDSVMGAAFNSDQNVNVDLAAPSRAALDSMEHIGVHGLGADCWVAGFGIGQG